jgi:hypothetical protein
MSWEWEGLVLRKIDNMVWPTDINGTYYLKKHFKKKDGSLVDKIGMEAHEHFTRPHLFLCGFCKEIIDGEYFYSILEFHVPETNPYFKDRPYCNMSCFECQSKIPQGWSIKEND